MNLTKEQFEAWKALPETQERYHSIHKQIRELEEAIGSGKTVTGSSIDATALNTAVMVGQIRGLMSVLEDQDIEFEEDEKEVL